MLTEMRDTLGLVMLGMGKDPARCTLDDAQRAAARVTQARESGQVRAFTGNDYADDLASGNVLIAFAWSGDIQGLRADNPDLQWIAPREGAILFSDNMMIPKGAAHPVDAATYMDYVYQPDVAGQMAQWINYITPVPDSKQFVLDLYKQTGDEYYKNVADSPLVYPTAEQQAALHSYRVLTEDEQLTWNGIFQPIYQS